MKKINVKILLDTKDSLRALSNAQNQISHREFCFDVFDQFYRKYRLLDTETITKILKHPRIVTIKDGYITHRPLKYNAEVLDVVTIEEFKRIQDGNISK